MKPIFSDDPQAIEKLQAKIAKLEQDHKFMKEINAIYKKEGVEGIKDKVRPETIRFYAHQHSYSWNKGRFYPAYALSNNSANIRTAKKRLEQLTKRLG